MLTCAHDPRDAKSGVKAATDILSAAEASRLADYKRAVVNALPGMERLILFGSRARSQASIDSDYDVAVVIRDLSDRRRVRHILSDLAYDHILSGFIIRPIPVTADYLSPNRGRPTELAEDIMRDGVQVI